MLVREHLTFTAGKVETVNDVLVLPARHSVEEAAVGSQPTGHSCTLAGQDLAQV